MMPQAVVVGAAACSAEHAGQPQDRDHHEHRPDQRRQVDLGQYQAAGSTRQGSIGQAGPVRRGLRG